MTVARHVVQYSTGVGSAEVAVRVVAAFGASRVTLLTADTLVEHPDNWRFAREVHQWLGEPEWVIQRDGRTPMQVGRDEGCVPNDRMAVCSRVLKRRLLRRYLDETHDPEHDVVYLGYDWTELPRLDRARPHWAPWQIAAPLSMAPYRSKGDLLASWRERGIEPPWLYSQGFSHANCGGGCVRGGQAQWALLLRVDRQTYLRWEAEEEQSRLLLDKNVSILSDRRGGGPRRPLTLRSFRERLDTSPSLFDVDDWGACGCAEAGAS